ncbi:MAG: hypothetical protein RLY93_19515 [Sumerlaeia bacterium]
MDEGPVQRCLGLLGHKAGKKPHKGWKVKRLKTAGNDLPKTEDGEVLTRDGDAIVVLGSHYGSKNGPLEPVRHYAARLREDELEGKIHSNRPAIQAARNDFAFHRAFNDAIRRTDLALLKPGYWMVKKLLAKTQKQAVDNEEPWMNRLRSGDYPLNIEGAAILPGGELLLGLRYPITRDGHPVIVRCRSVEDFFSPTPPNFHIEGFHVLPHVGGPQAPAGIRAMQWREDGTLHVLTGNLDSKQEKSVLLRDHPHGGEAPCEHWVVAASDFDHKTREWPSHRLRVFHDDDYVEGLAPDDEGRWHYVSDRDDHVRLIVVTE